jgi:hypothetical protein
MSTAASWIGSVWSLRAGKVLIGRLRDVDGDGVTLAVVGLGFVAPPDVEVLPPDADGATMVRVPLRSLIANWKRMGAVPQATAVD